MSRNNKELEASLKRIADDYRLPGGGRKKLSQLVAEHLDWFDAAQKRGMGWRDIISALAAASITGKRGEPLSIGTLSSTVWRKRAEIKQDDNVRSLQGARPRPPAKFPKFGSSTKDFAFRRDKSGDKPGRDSQTSTARTGRTANAGRSISTKQPPPIRAKSHSSKDLLDFMNRAKIIRRREIDE